MKYLSKKGFALRLAGFALMSVLSVSGVISVSAQDQKTPPKPVSSGGRDPFYNPYKPKPVITKRPAMTPKVALKPSKPLASVVTPPEIQARINFYKAQKQAALLEQRAPPKPTTAFLIEELEIAGIFRTPRGYAAMVQAKPIKLSYIIYPGETLYDGQLVAIDDDQVVFRHHLSWSDGRSEVRVERKPLRAAGAAEDALTQEKTSPSATAPNAAPAPAPVPSPADNTATPAPAAQSPASLTNLLLNSVPARGDKNSPPPPASEPSSGGDKPAPPAAKSKPAPKRQPSAKAKAKKPESR